MNQQLKDLAICVTENCTSTELDSQTLLSNFENNDVVLVSMSYSTYALLLISDNQNLETAEPNRSVMQNRLHEMLVSSFGETGKTILSYLLLRKNSTYAVPTHAWTAHNVNSLLLHVLALKIFESIQDKKMMLRQLKVISNISVAQEDIADKTLISQLLSEKQHTDCYVCLPQILALPHDKIINTIDCNNNSDLEGHKFGFAVKKFNNFYSNELKNHLLASQSISENLNQMKMKDSLKVNDIGAYLHAELAKKTIS